MSNVMAILWSQKQRRILVKILDGCRVQHAANHLWIFLIPCSQFCVEDHFHFRCCPVYLNNWEMGQIMHYWAIRLIQQVHFFNDPMFVLVLYYPVCIGIQIIGASVTDHETSIEVAVLPHGSCWKDVDSILSMVIRPHIYHCVTSQGYPDYPCNYPFI